MPHQCPSNSCKPWLPQPAWWARDWCAAAILVFLWCLTFGQPDASICWLGASGTRVRVSNSMPTDVIWNSSSWREWWVSQLVSSRHEPSDEEEPPDIAQRVSPWTAPQTSAGVRLSAPREAFSRSQWYRVFQHTRANAHS